MSEELSSAYDQRNSEEVNEIITAVPSWIVRSGITVIFVVIAGIVSLSAFIEYPDIVKTSLKVNSLNAPKDVIARQSGKLIRLLVKENQVVKYKQPLAYLESTASHIDILRLSEKLKFLRSAVVSEQTPTEVIVPEGLNLGELQPAYQTFYQSYLQFINTLKGGHYLKQKAFLQKGLTEINKLKQNIISQKEVEQMQFANAEQRYQAYKKLMDKGVISVNEFKQEEDKYFSSKYPLQQTTTELLNNNSSYLAKQKEILDLENTIAEQKAKYIQALNAIINDTDVWIMKFVLSASVGGTVSFAGIIQENQNVNINDELFTINPGNTDFFGQVQIPQYNMGKIRAGQRVLVKLRSYPFEEYGLIKGKLTHLSDVALKDSVFTGKIEFEHYENKDPDRKIRLKNGMMADAEIITEESSLLQRFTRNIRKMLNRK